MVIEDEAAGSLCSLECWTLWPWIYSWPNIYSFNEKFFSKITTQKKYCEPLRLTGIIKIFRKKTLNIVQVGKFITVTLTKRRAPRVS